MTNWGVWGCLAGTGLSDGSWVWLPLLRGVLKPPHLGEARGTPQHLRLLKEAGIQSMKRLFLGEWVWPVTGELAPQPAGASAAGGGSLRKRPVCAWLDFCRPMAFHRSCRAVVCLPGVGGGKAWRFMEVPIYVGTQGDAARNVLSCRSPEPIYR